MINNKQELSITTIFLKRSITDLGRYDQAQRAEEMERLFEGLGQSLKSQGTCFFVSGSAGLGKTYMIGEVEKMATAAGFSVHKASGGQEQLLSWQLFKRLFPELSDDINGPNDNAAVLVLDEIRRECSKTPQLIVIDNLHLVDDGAFSILTFLVRNIRALPVMLLGTFQEEQLLGAENGLPHPMIESMRVLKREGLCQEIGLKPFDKEGLISVLANDLQGPIEVGLSEQLWERSEGNPMFALEAARLLVQTRQIEKRGGMWQAAGPLSLDIPDEYVEIIERRLERLSSEDRKLLEIGAVIGERFNPRIIARIQHRALLDVLEQIDNITRDTRLVYDDDDAYRFCHRATQIVLLSKMSFARKKELHRLIGKVLESGNPPDASLGDVADHFYNAEIKDKCVCFSLLSGHQFMDREEWRNAIAEFQKVLDATADGGFEEERRMSIESMADAQLQLGGVEEARKRYDELLLTAGKEEERARLKRKLGSF
jgi:hypothetical protein